MDYSGRTRAVRPLRSEDDFDHPIEVHECFNESRYVHLVDRSGSLGGWFRIGRRPNQGHAEVTVCLYLPDKRVGFVHAKPAIGRGGSPGHAALAEPPFHSAISKASRNG